MSEVVKKLNAEAEAAKRKTLADMLDKLARGQREKFEKVFVRGRKEIPVSELDNAINVVERTLHRNETEPGFKERCE